MKACYLSCSNYNRKDNVFSLTCMECKHFYGDLYSKIGGDSTMATKKAVKAAPKKAPAKKAVAKKGSKKGCK